MNASSQYYSNEVREYPQQFGMQEYYAKEYLQDLGYSGASGWGYHNAVAYKVKTREIFYLGDAVCFLGKNMQKEIMAGC